jgi:hypothetical protein
VNGRQIVRNRQPLTLKAAEIVAKAKEYRERILKSLKN